MWVECTAVVECGVVDSSDMPVLVCSINTCTVVIIVVFNYVCECTVGIDVGDALMLAMR